MLGSQEQGPAPLLARNRTSPPSASEGNLANAYLTASPAPYDLHTGDTDPLKLPTRPDIPLDIPARHMVNSLEAKELPHAIEVISNDELRYQDLDYLMSDEEICLLNHLLRDTDTWHPLSAIVAEIQRVFGSTGAEDKAFLATLRLQNLFGFPILQGKGGIKRTYKLNESVRFFKEDEKAIAPVDIPPLDQVVVECGRIAIKEKAASSEKSLAERDDCIKRIVRTVQNNDHFIHAVNKRTLMLKDHTGLQESSRDTKAYHDLNTQLFTQLETAISGLGGIDKLAQLDLERVLAEDEDATHLLFGIGTAYKILFELHSGHALKIARNTRFRESILALSDIEQEALVGLSDAITRYNLDRGYAFTTYATAWIRTAILKAIAGQSRAIYLPYEKNLELRALGKAYSAFLQENGRRPTEAEISIKMGLDIEKVRILNAMDKRPISLDAALSHNNANTLNDKLSDPRNDYEPTDEDGPTKMLAELLRHRKLDNSMRIILGLRSEIPPSLVSRHVRTIAAGRLATYQELYQQYKQLLYRANTPAAKEDTWKAHISTILGMRSLEVTTRHNQALQILRKHVETLAEPQIRTDQQASPVANVPAQPDSILKAVALPASALAETSLPDQNERRGKDSEYFLQIIEPCLSVLSRQPGNTFSSTNFLRLAKKMDLIGQSPPSHFLDRLMSELRKHPNIQIVNNRYQLCDFLTPPAYSETPEQLRRRAHKTLDGHSRKRQARRHAGSGRLVDMTIYPGDM